VRAFRLTALYVAVCAMVLHALIPVGWMRDSNAGEHTVLVPCPMMDGMRMPAPVQHHPAKHQSTPASHEGSICPFAVAPNFVRLPPPRIAIADAYLAPNFAVRSSLARDWDHVPRAPPPLST